MSEYKLFMENILQRNPNLEPEEQISFAHFLLPNRSRSLTFLPIWIRIIGA